MAYNVIVEKFHRFAMSSPSIGAGVVLDVGTNPGEGEGGVVDEFCDGNWCFPIRVTLKDSLNLSSIKKRYGKSWSVERSHIGRQADPSQEYPHAFWN